MVQPRLPSLFVSLVPAAALVGLLFVSIALLGGSGHIPLIVAASIAALLTSTVLGQSWTEVEAGLIAGVSHALPAVFILMAVGLLIGVWIASGVVPLLIYYGLAILAPSYFLAAACLACAVVSLATGSSWSTAATAGLALIGVGSALGVSDAMTAGAVISGAYFGDKLSPLSDTTNLAAATAGSELFEHIRHMLYTTVPALALALGGYLALGWGVSDTGFEQSERYRQIISALEGGFDLSPWLLLAPLAVLILIARRTPPLPSLLAGTAVGVALLLVFQPQNAPDGMASVLSALYEGYESKTGIAAADELLSRGGLTSMLDTIALILCAVRVWRLDGELRHAGATHPGGASLRHGRRLHLFPPRSPLARDSICSRLISTSRSCFPDACSRTPTRRDACTRRICLAQSRIRLRSPLH